MPRPAFSSSPMVSGPCWRISSASVRSPARSRTMTVRAGRPRTARRSAGRCGSRSAGRAGRLALSRLRAESLSATLRTALCPSLATSRARAVEPLPSTRSTVPASDDRALARRQRVRLSSWSGAVSSSSTWSRSARKSRTDSVRSRGLDRGGAADQVVHGRAELIGDRRRDQRALAGQPLASCVRGWPRAAGR